MNGPTSILNTWLKSNDPMTIIHDLFSLYNKYNSLTADKFINKIKRWWIEKVSYPLLRHRSKKIQIATVLTLYDHPDCLIFILTRFLVALQVYVERYPKLTVNDIITSLFPNNSISLKIKVDPIDMNAFSVASFELIIRSKIVTDEEDKINDKFAITTVEASIYTGYYTIAQIAYDTDDENRYNTAKILYSKEFRLDDDGRLSNPNYVLDKSLLDEDILYYRLIISQVMVFIGGFFDEMTKLYFIDIKPK